MGNHAFLRAFAMIARSPSGSSVAREKNCVKFCTLSQSDVGNFGRGRWAGESEERIFNLRDSERRIFKECE